jgi:hypothetical protein
VIFDRRWLVEAARKAGLVVVWVGQPIMRGHQWYIGLRAPAEGVIEVALPEDTAPYGTWEAPPPAADLHRVGLDAPAASKS